MQGQESDDHVDKSQWVEWDEKTPLLTPERRAKGDIRIEVPCPDCLTLSESDRRACRTCKGKRRIPTSDPAVIAASEVRYAQAVVNTVMNHLHRAGVLNHDHVHDGQTYQAWQMLFAAGLGYGVNRIYRGALSDIRRMVRDDGLVSDDYDKLANSLSAGQRRIIDFSVTAAATEHNRWLASRHHDAYRRAFDRLCEVMESLREETRKRNEEKNACAHDPIRAY